MTNEIEVHQSTDLALDQQQATWTPRQLAALAQIGVEDASPGDLEVFFHVCKRSGLDPFARQIHMIGRNTKDPKTDRWVTKYTIQTGIDGFRLIGRRAADHARHTVSVSAPEWCNADDGQWRPVWSQAWGMPLAARVEIRRAGEPFTAVALFDEYKQTRKNGDLTSMWRQRPAGQLAKCAEALAWRMAFPQDLSGIYTEEELQHSENPPPAPATGGLRAALTPQSSPTQDTSSHSVSSEPVDVAEPSAASVGEPADAEPMFAYRSGWARGSFFPALRAAEEAGMVTDAKEFMSEVTGRNITTSKELTEAEAQMVYDNLPTATATEDPT